MLISPYEVETFNQTCLTEKEIAEDVFNDLSEDEKDYLRSKTEGELIIFHHNQNRWIRNHYQLWHPEHPYTQIGVDVRDGVDYSPNHPDEYSGRVTKIVWEMCHNEFSQLHNEGVA